MVFSSKKAFAALKLFGNRTRGLACIRRKGRVQAVSASSAVRTPQRSVNREFPDFAAEMFSQKLRVCFHSSARAFASIRQSSTTIAAIASTTGTARIATQGS